MELITRNGIIRQCLILRINLYCSNVEQLETWRHNKSKSTELWMLKRSVETLVSTEFQAYTTRYGPYREWGMSTLKTVEWGCSEGSKRHTSTLMKSQLTEGSEYSPWKTSPCNNIVLPPPREHSA